MRRKPWWIVPVVLLAIGWCGAGASDPSPATEAALRRVTLEIQRGRDALAVGNLRKAEARFRKALAVDPGSPEALVGIGEIQMHRREFQEALRSFLTAETEFRARFENTDARLRALHQDEAASAAELRQRARILRFNIDRLESGLDGQSTGDTGRRHELLRTYRQEVAALDQQADRLEAELPPDTRADEPVPGELYCAIGNARLRMADLEAAVEAWDRCVALRPEIGWVHNNLAAAHVQLGRPDRARFHMDRAVGLGFAVHPALRADIEAAEARDAPTSEFR